MTTEECPHSDYLTPATCSICKHGSTPPGQLTPKTTNCRSCDEEVFWGVNVKTDKRSPINAEPAMGGNVSITGWDPEGIPELTFGARGTGPYTSHFSTCHDAGHWRSS